jgi:hypothetical protein
MRSHRTIARAIQRKRNAAKGYPKKPKTYDDMATIPQHLTETSDKLPFLVLNETVIPNNTALGAKRLLVYMSDMGKEILASCNQWYCDGTFKSATGTLFTQV